MRAKLPVNTTLAPSSGIGDSTHHAADTSKGDSRTVTVKSLCGESASTKPSARRLPLSTAGSESLDEFSNSVLSDMGILDDDDFGSECGSGDFDAFVDTHRYRIAGSGGKPLGPVPANPLANRHAAHKGRSLSNGGASSKSAKQSAARQAEVAKWMGQLLGRSGHDGGGGGGGGNDAEQGGLRFSGGTTLEGLLAECVDDRIALERTMVAVSVPYHDRCARYSHFGWQVTEDI